MTKSLFDIQDDQLHTFDSFFGPKISKGDQSVIPFLNLGIANHELNQSDELVYIDYCYLIFEKVASITENYDIEPAVEQTNVFYFGGVDITNGKHREFQVKSARCRLKVPEGYNFSRQPWSLEQFDKNEIERFCSNAGNI